MAFLAISLNVLLKLLGRLYKRTGLALLAPRILGLIILILVPLHHLVDSTLMYAIFGTAAGKLLPDQRLFSGNLAFIITEISQRK